MSQCGKIFVLSAWISLPIPHNMPQNKTAIDPTIQCPARFFCL